MLKDFQNFHQFNKLANLKYNTILISYLFFLTVAYALTKKHHFNLTDINPVLLLLNTLSSLLIFLMTGYIKKSLTKKASEISGTKEKLKIFQHFLVINLIILTIYGTLNAYGFYLTHNLVFMFFSAYTLLLILLMKPKTEKISFLLNFTDKENQYIDNPQKKF